MIDFIGIGFRRCASSFINDSLYNIPFICKPYSGLHFFNYGYYRGFDWYHNQIFKYKSSESRSFGEFSTTYSYLPFLEKSVTRMFNYNPNIKIICCVRNPIDRFISDYNRSIALGYYPEYETDIIKIATNDYSLLLSGMYGHVLECYLTKFSLEQFHIVNFDDLNNDPSRSINKICNFLGFDYNYNGTLLPLSSYSSHISKRSEFIVKLKKFMKSKLNIKQRNIFKPHRKCFDNRSFTNKDWLYDFYQEDIVKLQKITNKCFFVK